MGVPGGCGPRLHKTKTAASCQMLTDKCWQVLAVRTTMNDSVVLDFVLEDEFGIYWWTVGITGSDPRMVPEAF